MAFRPTLWPTLFTVPALIALVALGLWQVQRLHWKADLIEKLQTRSTSAAVAPPGPSDDLTIFEFQRVAVSGRFRHDHELFVVGRSLRGNPGLHVLTPFERSDGAPAVLVNRGWVPFDKQDPATRAEGQVAGPVTIEGIVRLQRPPGWFTPDDDPKKNNWFTIDSKKMSQVTGVPLAGGFYIVADKAGTPGEFPVGRQWRLDIRNNHLEYAITWFALAAALLVIYLLYHRNRS